MSDVTTNSSVDVAVVVTEALRPFKVAYVFRVAVLTAVVVGVIALGAVVFSTAGSGAAASTVVVAAVVGWFATPGLRSWFGRYTGFVAWVKRRAFTVAWQNGKDLRAGFAGEIAVARKLYGL